MHARPGRLAGLTLAAALALSACSGGGDPIEEQASDQPSAASGAAPQTSTPAPADAAGQAAATTDPNAVEPAQAQTVELGESMSVSTEESAFTITVHRVLVHDYYVEAEITLVNDADDELKTWYGSATAGSPRLYDDRGRTYAFQVQAGGDDQTLRLQPGEGVDAVLVFAGRVDAEATALTLDFSEIYGDGWSQVSFDAPLAGRR